MARLKSSLIPEKISGGYSGIPWNVIDSQSFKGASDKAKSLLFAVMRQHNGSNNGRLHLSKKWLRSQGWTCDSSNRKATKELIERGLIVQTKWGGLNMGPNMYALTWHIISNFVGLDISSKTYPYAAYTLCSLPPTARRKPPAKKQSGRLNDCDWDGSTIEPAGHSTGSTTESIRPVLASRTGPAVENNVFIPLPPIKKRKRIVGVKGKSGIKKTEHGSSVVQQSQALIH